MRRTFDRHGRVVRHVCDDHGCWALHPPDRTMESSTRLLKTGPMGIADQYHRISLVSLRIHQYRLAAPLCGLARRPPVATLGRAVGSRKHSGGHHAVFPGREIGKERRLAESERVRTNSRMKDRSFVRSRVTTGVSLKSQNPFIYRKEHHGEKENIPRQGSASVWICGNPCRPVMSWPAR